MICTFETKERPFPIGFETIRKGKIISYIKPAGGIIAPGFGKVNAKKGEESVVSCVKFRTVK